MTITPADDFVGTEGQLEDQTPIESGLEAGNPVPPAAHTMSATLKRNAPPGAFTDRNYKVSTRIIYSQQSLRLFAGRGRSAIA
jgi:hypothetical protein